MLPSAASRVRVQQITNDFTWSKSRHEKFNECARAYYYHYYGSWNGWLPEANHAVKELWILKKLSNRFTWAGKTVHDTIGSALRAMRAGRELDPEFYIQRAHLRMRQEWKDSSAKNYWTLEGRRYFAGLVEHEYSEPIEREVWATNWKNVEQALRWFFASPWLARARALKPDQWIEVDENRPDETCFPLDGVKVFAIPDFVYRDDEGRAVLVDWKTGHARDGYDDQVLGYALYLSLRYGFSPERISATLVYLNDGIEKTVQIDAAALERFKATARESIGRMKAMLSDPAKNVPRPIEAFAMTENLEKCKHCVFRRACGRSEAQQVNVAA
jgi:hypothetical protein